jgi:hypothetical protein
MVVAVVSAATAVLAVPIGDSASLLNKSLSMLAGDAVEVPVGRGGMRMDAHCHPDLEPAGFLCVDLVLADTGSGRSIDY